MPYGGYFGPISPRFGLDFYQTGKLGHGLLYEIPLVSVDQDTISKVRPPVLRLSGITGKPGNVVHPQKIIDNILLGEKGRLT